ncbi:Signal transduction histidine kinase [Halobiforma haloterrestris]|uniref:histidine kinase n=1 Tax=Natronobacterium haloterrestre TaxID=148448 RepID=A0A1I1KVD7_NATHA|nr:HAMP domain-containing sensor histidine kinase [Halobiforma haloterrestris]SFC62698.1 Signal transduction histidine kinase [Halobiforma haloterrestris]
MPLRSGEIRLEGLLVALLGFGLTRLVVAETLRTETAVPFLVVGTVPLVVGLGLAVFGVVLAVGAFRRSYVRTVAGWTVLGTAAMTVVLGLTAAEAALRGDPVVIVSENSVLVANVLLGGAVGGALTGDRSAANRHRRREVERQVDQAVLINRVLRHEVLNSATIVRGYSELLPQRSDDDSVDAIREAADRIEATIEEIGEFADPSVSDLGAVDIEEVVRAELAGRGLPAETDLESVRVVADERLGIVVGELLENAFVHGTKTDAGETDGNPPVRVAIDASESVVHLRVIDDGPGLPARPRGLLEEGTLPEYDDPSSGFGLQQVRLLVERYEGTVSVEVDDGTTVTVSLPRATPVGEPTSPLEVGRRDLFVAGIASIVAGVTMGLYLDVVQGLLPVIGALYGVENPTVGWVTHLFHSLVFGLLFAAGMVRPTFRSHDGVGKRIALGAGWGVVLWLVAAGFVMPVWLSLVGLEAPLPNLSRAGLVSHVLWGTVLGGFYGVVSRWLSWPRR